MKAAALSAHANAPLQIFPTSSAQPANWNRFKSVSPFLRCPADAICRQCGQHLSRARQPRSPLRLRAEGESISAPNFSSTQRTPKVERGGWQQACVASGDGDVTTGEWETGHRQRRVEKVLTATRIGDEGAVRVMGPGTDLPQGWDRNPYKVTRIGVSEHDY